MNNERAVFRPAHGVHAVEILNTKRRKHGGGKEAIGLTDASWIASRTTQVTILAASVLTGCEQQCMEAEGTSLVTATRQNVVQSSTLTGVYSIGNGKR